MGSAKVKGMVVLMAIGLWIVGNGFYCQSSVACDNALNTVARNYNACKTGLKQDVVAKLLPLIAKRDALKKQLDELTALLANFDKKKEELTKSIEALQKEIQAKGCINCPSLAIDNNNTNNNTNNNNTNAAGASSSSCGQDKDKEPSCKLPNICSLCSGLIHQKSGKPLCEICGCNCGPILGR